MQVDSQKDCERRFRKIAFVIVTGRPKPSVTWWKDGELLDGVVDTVPIGSPNRFTVNDLFVDKVTKSLWGAKLECRAQSAPMGKPIVREVSLDIYRKYYILNDTKLHSENFEELKSILWFWKIKLKKIQFVNYIFKLVSSLGNDYELVNLSTIASHRAHLLMLSWLIQRLSDDEMQKGGISKKRIINAALTWHLLKIKSKKHSSRPFLRF